MLSSLGVIDPGTYVLGVIFVILLPGPNSLFVLVTGARRGVSAGYRAACGVFVGDAVLMLLSAVGVASVLKAQPMLFVGLKYAGAAYLFYLGITMLMTAWQNLQGPRLVNDPAVSELVDVHSPFGRALLLSLSNPKAILFFISFFIQFVDPAYEHPGLSFLVLGVILEFFSFVYLSFLIFAGSALAAWFRQRNRLRAGATAGVGALFIGFGLKLAAASLS